MQPASLEEAPIGIERLRATADDLADFVEHGASVFTGWTSAWSWPS